MKNGWQIKTLGELAEAVSTGPFGSMLHKADYVERGIPLVNPTNMIGERIVVDQSMLINESTRARLSRYVLKEGDVVVARRGEIGRCAIVSSDQAGWLCGTGSFFIRPSAQTDSRFLAHLLRSPEYREQLEASATGTTMKNLSNTSLSELSVSIPALAEQRRIVRVLDDAFAGLAIAQANAEKNLQNARALFESHLHNVFTHRNKGWVEKKLGAVAGFKNGLNYTRESKGQTLPVVGVGDFQGNTIVPLERLQTARIDGKLSPEYAIQAGDILTVRSNGSKNLVGRSMLVPEVSRTTSYSGFIIRVRVNAAEVFPAFLLHLMKSRATRDRLVRDGGGANISNINQTKLAALPVSLPSIAEQKKIVAQLDALAAETQCLAQLYKQKLSALAALKKSLLHQAFTGEL